MKSVGKITRFGTGYYGDCGSLEADDGKTYGFNLSNVSEELRDLLIDDPTSISSIKKVTFTPSTYTTRKGVTRDIAKNVCLEKEGKVPKESQHSLLFYDHSTDEKTIYNRVVTAFPFEAETNESTVHFDKALSSEPTENNKSLLSPKEQLIHMESQNIILDLDDEAILDYFKFHNNYFRVRSFRSGFKRLNSIESRPFVNLNFSSLVELSEIDALVRETLLHLSLDIEQAAKMEILRKAESIESNPYSIVEDFFQDQQEKQDEAEKNGNHFRALTKASFTTKLRSAYVGGLVKRYGDSRYPIWAFLELISFGNLNYFYMFCAERFKDDKMKTTFFFLQIAKNMRNACAHSNCILNDLGFIRRKEKTPREVKEMLRSLDKLNKEEAFGLMNNPKVNGIITTLYTHSILCTQHAHKLRQLELKNILDRFNLALPLFEKGENKQIIQFISLFNQTVEYLYL